MMTWVSNCASVLQAVLCFSSTVQCAAGAGSSGWSSHLQDALLATTVRCIKARPKMAATYLGETNFKTV